MISPLIRGQIPMACLTLVQRETLYMGHGQASQGIHGLVSCIPARYENPNVMWCIHLRVYIYIYMCVCVRVCVPMKIH